MFYHWKFSYNCFWESHYPTKQKTFFTQGHELVYGYFYILSIPLNPHKKTLECTLRLHESVEAIRKYPVLLSGMPSTLSSSWFLIRTSPNEQFHAIWPQIESINLNSCCCSVNFLLELSPPL